MDMEILRNVENFAQFSDNQSTVSRNVIGRYFYWSNIYHWKDQDVPEDKQPVDLPLYNFWTRMVLNHMKFNDAQCAFTPELQTKKEEDHQLQGGVQHVHVFYADREIDGIDLRKSITNANGWVVRFRAVQPDGKPMIFEALVQESQHRFRKAQKRMESAPRIPRLTALEIGTKWDVKNSFYWGDGYATSYASVGSNVVIE